MSPVMSGTEDDTHPFNDGASCSDPRQFYQHQTTYYLRSTPAAKACMTRDQPRLVVQGQGPAVQVSRRVRLETTRSLCHNTSQLGRGWDNLTTTPTDAFAESPQGQLYAIGNVWITTWDEADSVHRAARNRRVDLSRHHIWNLARRSQRCPATGSPDLDTMIHPNTEKE